MKLTSKWTIIFLIVIMAGSIWTNVFATDPWDVAKMKLDPNFWSDIYEAGRDFTMYTDTTINNKDFRLGNGEMIRNQTDGELTFTYNDTAAILAKFVIVSSIDTLADDNVILKTIYRANDDDNNAVDWAEILTTITDVTNDSKDSQISFKTYAANSSVTPLTLTGADATFAGSVSTATALNPDASDGAALGTTALEWSDLFLADGAVIYFGDDQDVSLTHVADTGLLLNTTMAIQFRDATETINASVDGQLDIDATTEVEITTTTVDLNGALDVSSTIVGGSTISAATSFNPDAADGATIGTAALEFSDLYLADAGVIYLGADQDVSLTHVADAGVMLNAAMALRFRDAALNINSSADGQLDIDADTEIELTTTTVDLNGILDVDGKLVLESSRTGGANTANSYKMTLAASETFTGTTGHIFKIYDADNTVVHDGGEHCGVYVNMKQLSAMASGGKSVLFSGHNYGSGGDYQIIDAGVWLYGNLVDAFKISGGSIDTGLDFSETTVTGSDIQLSNGAKIFSGTAANGDAVYAEVGARDATGSIYISTAAGAIYVQVANAGAATDWFKCTSTDAD